MRLLTVIFFMAATPISAFAFDEQDAAALVRKYSETISCRADEMSEFQENQYKGIMINPGRAELGGLGARFVVYWEGDIGCKGGNGTIVPNFTVVEHSGYSSANPVVRPDYKLPKIDLVQLTSFSEANDKIYIEGLTYGPHDSHNYPTKSVHYTIKLLENEFVIE